MTKANITDYNLGKSLPLGVHKFPGGRENREATTGAAPQARLLPKALVTAPLPHLPFLLWVPALPASQGRPAMKPKEGGHSTRAIPSARASLSALLGSSRILCAEGKVSWRRQVLQESCSGPGHALLLTTRWSPWPCGS